MWATAPFSSHTLQEMTILCLDSTPTWPHRGFSQDTGIILVLVWCPHLFQLFVLFIIEPDKSGVIWNSLYWLKVLKSLDFPRYISHTWFALSSKVWVLYPRTHMHKNMFLHSFSPSTLPLVCFKIYYFIKEAEWEKINCFILEGKNHDFENIRPSQHCTESK